MNKTCELYVNSFKLKTKEVYAYLIDWGENIPSNDLALKGDAKRTSKDQLKKIFSYYIFMHNYVSN